MGIGRQTSSESRPIKSARERKRRRKVHIKRLVGLGVTEESAQKMNSKEIRTLLKRPMQTAKKMAASK